MSTEITINRPVVRADALGMSTKQVRKTAIQVLRAARREAHGPYSTGRLSSSLRLRYTFTQNSVTAIIYSPLDHAGMAEGGTPRHLIVPRRPGGKLRFYWRKTAMTHFFGRVNHPGYPGKGYLRRSLRYHATRNGFRVITSDYAE